jgi:protein involved in polysaccharide export with SLBB domain
MSLEDGDRFVVPAKPATVNVIGSVYNPNSFIHASEKPVQDYVRQAGGFTRNADESRMYIILADGSVVPKQHTSRFAKQPLNPGDSIVIPENMMKTSFMVGLRNWSQIISQFGLGAAAVNVLR